jgi:hypothetical protein
MPFTAQELENIANAAIDFHFRRGQVHSQTIQEKPLLRTMKAKQKTFPGGKENITVRVKGEYSTTIMGFEHDDTVTYQNPANIKTATFPWKEIHAGISCTLTELKKDGISVVDSANSKSTTSHSNREETALANLLEDKLEDMSEGYSRGKNEMLWRDGTQDAKQVPGVTSFILDDPTSATVVAGIDQSSNDWWRNRASLGIAASDATLQGLVQTLQREYRQLRRFGGRPNTFLCGSDFMDWFERELRAKGNYTLEGWSKQGRIDASVADLTFKGVNLEYDPTLDDLSKAKYGYWLDTSCIYPMVMDGEDDKKHSPARPEDKYVLYRALTWTGGLVCKRRNSSGVYSIA